MKTLRLLLLLLGGIINPAFAQVRVASPDGRNAVTVEIHDGRLYYSVQRDDQDRKSTRLNSSHLVISYAVFCLKKKIIRHLSRRDQAAQVDPPARRDALRPVGPIHRAC